MTTDVLHLCYGSPHLPGSYNRLLGRFLESPDSAGHRVLSSGPRPPADVAISDKVSFTSGRPHSKARILAHRFGSRDAVERFAAHRDPTRAAYAVEALQVVRREQPAVVVVYDDYRLSLQVARSANRTFALAFAQHGTTYALPAGIAPALYDPRFLDDAIVLAEVAKEWIEAESSIPGLRIDVLANAVDTDRLRPPTDAERREARRALHGSSGPVVVFVGRVVRTKGLLDALEAMARVRHRRPEVRFVIAGVGDAAYEAELRQRVRTLDLDDLVVFAGRIRPEDIRQAYWAADLVIVPSIVPEGMPLVVLEAMAAGVPVVGYAFAAAAEVGGPAEGLTTVPTGDVAALASAIEDLVASPETRRTMATATRQVALERFSLEPWCTRYATIIESLAPEPGVRGSHWR